MDEVEERKRKRNEKSRESYRNMLPEDKARLLERRRQQYGERMTRLRSQMQQENESTFVGGCQNSQGVHMRQLDPSSCVSPSVNFVTKNCRNNMGKSSSEFSDNVNHDSMQNPMPANEYECSTRNRQTDRFSRLMFVATCPWELPGTPQCSFCRAHKFFREPPSFCCSNGEVSLAPISPNPILFHLFTADTSSIGIRFRRRVRSYNNNLALTSIGMKTDPQFCWSNQGIYTLKVNGQVMHKLEAFNTSVELPRRLQLFFLDIANDISLDSLKKYDLEPDILDLLLRALANNPYFKIFKRLRSWENLENCIVVLRANPQLNQKTQNLPTEEQIAVIWDETTDEPEDMNRDIKVYGLDHCPHAILYHYGCYDPLQYPLLFPHGEVGWHVGIERNSHSKSGGCYCIGQNAIAPALGLSASDILHIENEVYARNKKKRTNVSCREYTAYRCQIREFG